MIFTKEQTDICIFYLTINNNKYFLVDKNNKNKTKNNKKIKNKNEFFLSIIFIQIYIFFIFTSTYEIFLKKKIFTKEHFCVFSFEKIF